MIATLKSDEAIAVASEVAEAAIDAQLAEGVLREVPVVGTVLAVARAGSNIRDAIFVRKLLKFLRDFRATSQEERDAMIGRLEADPDYGRSVGQHLTDLLEKIDSHRKPAMLALVFLAYMRGQIDARMLNRLNHAIETLPFYEIDSIRRVHETFKREEKTDERPETYHALENAGLMKAESAWGGMVYLPTDLCEVFVGLELDRARA